jgi:hypothetical protein
LSTRRGLANSAQVCRQRVGEVGVDAPIDSQRVAPEPDKSLA